jgi:tripartite ATP-independent transporter DctM subunit
MTLMIAALFVSFFAMCCIGVPISISLIVASVITAMLGGISPIIIVQNMYAGIDSYTLLAIPLFLLVGQIMEIGSITERLITFSRSMVGHIRGSLGHVTVLSNMLMAGISGSAVADAAAIGGIMIPAMKKEGYPPEMAVAINATAATIGPIIPPSIIMVIYGAYGNVSIGSMFLGGAIPGFIFGLAIMMVVFFWSGTGNFPKHPKSTFHQRLASFRESSLALVTPFLIVGGIVGGVVTPTESAMIATCYSIAISWFVFKKLTIRNTIDAFKKTFLAVGNPLFCVSAAGAFGYLMAYLQVPNLVLQAFSGVLGHPLLILLSIMAIYLVLGTFMDAIPAIVIFLPIVQKMAASAGLDPVHVGVLVTVVLCFGFLTPPYGLTLLLCSGIGGVSVLKVARALAPMYLTMVGVVVLIIFFPGVVLFLPRLFF